MLADHPQYAAFNDQARLSSDGEMGIETTIIQHEEDVMALNPAARHTPKTLDQNRPCQANRTIE